MSLRTLAGPARLRAVFVLTLILVFGTSCPAAAPSPSDSMPAGETVYVCPMHPEIRRDAPGRCPICGMALVPRSTRRGEEGLPAVDLPARMIQQLGVRTEPVRQRTLPVEVLAPAIARIAEDRIRHVHTRVEGWVESIGVHSLGERVRKGQALFELYSPKLSAAQEDYLIALRQGGAGSRAERAAAFRLLTLGADEDFIARLAGEGRSSPRMPVRAPSDGVVTALGIRHGMFLEPMSVAAELSDLSELWVEVRLSAEELERLADPAPRVRLHHPGRAGRIWRAGDPVLLPLLDPVTRTQVLRYRVPNRKGLLAPGDFLTAELRGAEGAPVLAVPRSAVIRLPDGARVFRAEGHGRFRPVPVTLGRAAGGFIEVREGLAEGDQVVTRAQFLLDAEASLRAGIERYQAGEDHAH